MTLPAPLVAELLSTPRAHVLVGELLCFAPVPPDLIPSNVALGDVRASLANPALSTATEANVPHPS